MKIVIVSLTFLPRTGGLENIMSGLAEQWHHQGHEVVVYTKIKAGPLDYGYKVIRQFSIGGLLRAVAGADVFFEANISLKTCIVGLLHKKKWFVTHHIFYQHSKSINADIKNYLTKFSNNISPSRFIAGCLRGKSIVIHNFYNPIFKKLPEIKKTGDIIFVGRLVSDKGATDLINSLRLLQQDGLNLSCSIAGDGPEKKELEQQVIAAGLQYSVIFKGVLQDNELVKEINRYKIMVIPSRWKEPFGIVVLEGLACGCKIVCSEGGGLPEAAGSFGLLFTNGDVSGLSESIKKAIYKSDGNEEEDEHVTKYLQAHTAPAVAEAYLQYFNDRIMRN